jgi:hypothetical protein
VISLAGIRKAVAAFWRLFGGFLAAFEKPPKSRQIEMCHFHGLVTFDPRK